MATALRWAILLVLACALAAAAVWGAAALWFDGPTSRPLAGAAAIAFLVAAVTLPLALPTRWQGVAAFGVLFVVLLGWWLAIPPRNDRRWQPDVRVPPTAERRGDLLVVHGVRNFAYRSQHDWDERWEDRIYDLRRLGGLDLFVSHWGSPLIAHTILSWQFDDAPPLAVSIETRKEEGESYSPVRGFFRQYELYYVAADERDVIALRANRRGEQVFLYRLRTPPETARRLLLSYADAMNALARTPRWYNAATQNCTTTIDVHVRHVLGAARVWDWRLWANGYLYEVLHERGVVNASLPLPALWAASDVTARARAAGDGPDFSARIREGLPPRPAPAGAN